MKILHLAFSNAAGVPGRWAAAQAGEGLEARLLLEVDDEFDFGATTRGAQDVTVEVRRWSNDWPDAIDPFSRVQKQIAWADALMVYDQPFYLESALLTGKPVLFRALGSHARSNIAQLRELLGWENVMRASAGTPDLALALGIELAGAPFPELQLAEPFQPPFAVHSPSNRMVKGTATIELAAREAGWELKVVEHALHAEVLSWKRISSLVIDQFGPGHGIGVAGIEAMAMGLPVVTSALPEVAQMYDDHGCPAVFISNRTMLVESLVKLRRFSDLRLELGARGQEWVRSHHGAARRAREDIRALGGVRA